MTDYLEPWQEENEDALWEAVRRLEERIWAAGENPSGPEESVERESEEKKRLLLPLLEEMEVLDRALGGWETPEKARTTTSQEAESGTGSRRGGFQLDTGAYRRGNIPWEGLPQGEAAVRPKGERTALWTDTPLQAEQVDQAFRRDSRRYDGGFFLY